MLKKQLILLSLFIILSSFCITAYSFDVDYEAIKSDISLNDGAEYEALITNNGGTTAKYRISLADYTFWTLQTVPLSHRLSGISVAPGYSVSSKLLIYPQENTVPGRYLIKVVLKKEDSNEEIRKSVEVNLKSDMYIPSYEPNLKADIIFPENGQIDPRGKKELTVYLKNRNALEIEDATLTLKSDLINLERSGISLAPLERKKIDFTIEFDPQELPRSDVLVATANIQNKTFVTIKEYEVIGYDADFSLETLEEKKILKKEKKYVLRNDANTNKRDFFRVETSTLSGLFTSTKPSATVVEENSQKYLSWQIDLEPGESVELKVTRNYRPLFYVLIILAISIYSYFLWRSSLIINKHVSEIGLKHGGISKFKVRVIIKNRTEKPIYNVTLIDKVPTIAKVEDNFPVGTLHPSKVLNKGKDGTILKWSVEVLEPKEERVIIYTVISRLSILGDFNLPLAVGKYKDEAGKLKTTSSNIVNLGK